MNKVIGFSRVRKVNWGKYKGIELKLVPSDYLEWFLSKNYAGKNSWVKWIKEELIIRKI